MSSISCSTELYIPPLLHTEHQSWWFDIILRNLEHELHFHLQRGRLCFAIFISNLNHLYRTLELVLNYQSKFIRRIEFHCTGWNGTLFLSFSKSNCTNIYMIEIKSCETNPKRCPTKSDFRIIASFELVILPNCVFVDHTPIVWIEVVPVADHRKSNHCISRFCNSV